MSLDRPAWRLEEMRDSLLRHRRPVVISLQLIVAAASHYAALMLRFDGAIPRDVTAALPTLLPILLALRAAGLIAFHLYEGLWRYTSIRDMIHVVGAVAVSTLAFDQIIRWLPTAHPYPRSVLLIDACVLVMLLAAMRLGRRLYRELARSSRDKRVLIYGAGDAGEMIVRDMRRNPHYEYEPIGFVDDNPAKVGSKIHGLKVLGTSAALGPIIAATRPDAVLVAIARAAPPTMRAIVNTLEPFKVPIQRLPNLRDLLDGKVSVGQIRTLSIEDLLERAPVTLDRDVTRGLVEGRDVLVTGAGGFIGRELCRQILALVPRRLTVLDRYENGLYATLNDLEAAALGTQIAGEVADVTNADRLRLIMSAARPQVVLHAAAHKHVPLMELNPCEAILNNVRGARVLIETACDMGVRRVVLVSSDKAVNPASVMGATKKIAEMLVQAANGQGGSLLTAVRFGNVLGSFGSVVPRFVEQIKAGGPVTITHPEMRRYFMLVSEAVGLVLHAASLATGGEIFVLSMGDQIRVLDLARNLIRLSGYLPDEEIAIKVIGIRPGEKLSEELVGADEQAVPSPVDGILQVQPLRSPELSHLRGQIGELECLAEQGDVAAVLKMLQTIVPTYGQAPEDGGRG
jgi:FlaA1/EpsC-like NDP-sugar epimerase